MSKKAYTGLNIQWPISQDILSKNKTIETRTYPCPEKYLNKDLILVETPGKNGNFKSRIVAIIRITSCFKYKTKKDFYNDTHRHLVTKDSEWAWKDKEKWGWNIIIVKTINPPQAPSKRLGIKYTNDLTIKL